MWVIDCIFTFRKMRIIFVHHLTVEREKGGERKTPPPPSPKMTYCFAAAAAPLNCGLVGLYTGDVGL